MINLTILSQNNKTIEATNLDTSTILNSFNNSESVALSYSNHLIKVSTGDTFNMENVGHITNQIPDNWIYFFVAFGLFICVVALARIGKI